MNAQKENTWRALQDQPLLVSSIWCQVRLHRWSQWSELIKAPDRTAQRRHCVHCNRVEFREIYLTT